ncbi:MAG: hypothetical protein ABL907_13295 [Hyphomicrobium sp.]
MVQLLAIAFATSLGVMVMSAARINAWMMTIAALGFCATALAAAVRINQPYWHRAHAGVNVTNGEGRALAAEAVRRTSHITALFYAWGGTAMFLIYHVSGLRWQHGWEYGLGMLIIGAGLAVYVAMLRNTASPLNSARSIDGVVKLAGLHGLAAFAAMTWLAASGKLATPKTDWAANIVFMTGGLAIVVLSTIVMRTHYVLTRPSDGAR